MEIYRVKAFAIRSNIKKQEEGNYYEKNICWNVFVGIFE